MDLNEIIHNFKEDNLQTKTRPYFNHSIELKKQYTSKERTKMLERVGLNVFFFPSEMITGCDMLSDSGTTTMTNEQWAALHKGDEAYGSNRGYFLLAEQIRTVFGEKFFNQPEEKPNAFIFHQGRPCEDALFSLIGKLGSNLIIPSNGHFDTTEANIEANKIQAINLFSSELKDSDSDCCFKGNMNTEKLKNLLEKSANQVPLIYLTITNNTGGGQPVSMENIKEVSEISHKHNIPLFFDACRFAENSWFIKNKESGYGNKNIPEIIREMFSYVDGFTISFKKDGLVNMGGGLFFRNDGLFVKKYPSMSDALTNHQILKEGHPTYGGLSGRNIMALVVGLNTVTKEKYLEHRINQVQDFGRNLRKKNLPVLAPSGGHAIYLDVNKFFADTDMKPEDFGGVALTAVLLAAYGHRAIELGNFAFGSYNKETGKETFPEVNFVRFAIPRLRYEKQDLDSVAEALQSLYEQRDKIPAVNVVYGKDLPLRHFKARFEFQKKATLIGL
ncbi:MAG: tryptophanase [Candidatus Aenigmatarchaeota archaeon]